MSISPKRIHPVLTPIQAGAIALLVLFCLFPARGERLPVKIYTSVDGLGSSFVNSIATDSRGLMWFCTRDGLSRFDGSEFVTYQIGDKKLQPGVEFIFESRSGTYWITTTGGTYRFDPRIAPPSILKPGVLNAEFVNESRGQFFEDSNGTLWSTGNGLARVVERDGKTNFENFELNLPAEIKDKTTVLNLVESSDGSFWMTVSNGLLRLLPNRHIVYYPHGENRTVANTDLVADKNGNIWFASSNSLFVIKPKPPESYPEPDATTVEDFRPDSVIELSPKAPYTLPIEAGKIYRFAGRGPDRFLERGFAKRILETSDGAIWVSNESTLLEFKNGVFDLHTEDEGLPPIMTELSEDSAGNLWIGGHTGLARIDLRGMVSYGKSDGSNSTRFFGINEAPNGTLFFTGFEFFLNEFRDGRLNPIRPGIPLDSIIPWTSRPAFLDSAGGWWFVTSNKLYYFAVGDDFARMKSMSPTKTYSTADGLASNAISSIFEDSTGAIWVSTRNSNIGEVSTARLGKGESRFRTFAESDGLPAGKSFSAAVEDRHGNVWFAFYQGGVARFDGTRFEYWDDGGRFDGGLLDIYLDKEDQLWVASSANGVHRIRDIDAVRPRFDTFTTENGLSSNNVRTVTGDQFGRIYFGTARGVDRLSPANGFFKHYSVNDGLAADFVVDSHRDRDGNVWFVTNNGISRLAPAPDIAAAAPKILLGRVLIAGEEQAIPQLGVGEFAKGDLSAGQNNLQIEFFGLDFRAGETLRYQFKLEGIDTDWSQPIDQRTVNFANLSSGSYRFLVRAVNSEGQMSERPAVVSFRLLPPIYLRWWFIVLSLALLAAIAVSIYRYRLSKLKEINAALTETQRAEEKLSHERRERLAELQKVRTRIATDLHDDIGASLTQISVLSSVARKAVAEGKENSIEFLQGISTISNELVEAMSDIVWAINPRKDSLHELVLRMRRFASDVLTASEIGFDLEAPENENESRIGANIRREVFAIFKECINNIVRHSGAKNVDVTFRMSGSEIAIRIVDDGRGFDTATVLADGFSPEKGGNGLINIRRRVADLGGECDIRSGSDGTTVGLRIPLSPAGDRRSD